MTRGNFRGRFNRGNNRPFRGGFRNNYGGRGGGRNSDRAHSNRNFVRQDQLKEVDVGISEYISDLEGFSGVIKARFSDFHVSEINLDGEIAKLTNTDIPKEFVPEEIPEVEVDFSTMKSPNEHIPETIWKQIIAMLDNNDKKVVHIDVTNIDKEQRKGIHGSINKLFREKIASNTVSKGDGKFIECKKTNKTDPVDKRIKWPEDLGEYVYFVVYKESMDTLEATYKIADALKMRAANFTYAGVKDRRAKTTQWFCIRKVDPKRLLNSTRHIRYLKIGNLTFKNEPLKLGQLKGNRFRIALKNVTADDELIEKAMSSLRDNGFINYYGLQRFGNDKEVPTSEIGLQLMLGNWKEACDLILKPKASDNPFLDITKAKKVYQETGDPNKALDCLKKNRNKCVESKLLGGLTKTHKNDHVTALESIPRNMRLLYIHSFQSLIWNKIVSRRINEFGLKPIPGDLVLKSCDEEKTLQLLEGGEATDINGQIWCGDITLLVDDASNVKVKLNKKKSTPWMTDELMKLIAQKDKLHTLSKKHPENKQLQFEYKAMRNKITTLIRKVKGKFYGNDNHDNESIDNVDVENEEKEDGSKEDSTLTSNENADLSDSQSGDQSENGSTENTSKTEEFPDVKVLTDEDLNQYTIFDIILPLPGYGIVYPENEVKDWYKEILEGYGLSLEMPKQRTKTYTLSGAYRKIVAQVQDCSWKTMRYNDPDCSLIQSDFEELKGEEDPVNIADGKFKALLLDFCLPPSCYATMALREILKTDTSSSSHSKLNNYDNSASNSKDCLEESKVEESNVNKRKLDGDAGEVEDKKLKTE